MTGEQKDLTRANALELAQAKWGAKAETWAVCPPWKCIVTNEPSRKAWPFKTTMKVRGKAHTWREACERAGLLPKETA